MKINTPEVIVEKIYFTPASDYDKIIPNSDYKEKVSAYGLGEYQCLDIERVFKYSFAYEQVIECFPNTNTEYSEGLGHYVVNHMITGDLFSFNNIKHLEYLVKLGADIKYATYLAHNIISPKHKEKTITPENFEILCFLLGKGCPINKTMMQSATLWNKTSVIDEFLKYEMDLSVLNYGLCHALINIPDIEESGLLHKFISKGANVFNMATYHKILSYKNKDLFFIVVDLLKHKYRDKYKEFI
jgi:hypothetical protein